MGNTLNDWLFTYITTPLYSFYRTMGMGCEWCGDAGRIAAGEDSLAAENDFHYIFEMFNKMYREAFL